MNTVNHVLLDDVSFNQVPVGVWFDLLPFPVLDHVEVVYVVRVQDGCNTDFSHLLLLVFGGLHEPQHMRGHWWLSTMLDLSNTDYA